tara:strand:+ start:161 stop:622 length:462 start_codon:yes stop_codon:yes gene_type:complete
MKKIYKINLVKFMQGISLLILAIVFTAFFVILSFIFDPIYYLIRLKWQSGLNHLGDWFKKLSISLYQFGNASAATMLNFALRKKGGIDFGDEDDTISYVIGRNYYHNSLTIFGHMIRLILHLIDRNHVQKAVDLKFESDQDALIRIKNDIYYK